MKKMKLAGCILGLACLAGTVVGCGGDDPNSVKLGLHTNYGAGAGYSALNQGFFEDEELNVTAQMGEGPALAASLVAGQINVSFMGNGVAWNYFTDKQEITLVALDNLTNDDKLIASTTGKGKDLTADSPVSDLADALRGSTVVLDQGATPMTFWGNLLSTINAQLEDADKLWSKNLKGDVIPKGADTSIAANEVILENSSNANVAVSMQKGEYDFCVAFAPVSTTLLNDTENFKMIASTLTHMPDTYTPSTWAVNTAWLETHQDTFQRFMNALVKGMNFRRDNQAECAKDIEKITAGTFIARIAAYFLAIGNAIMLIARTAFCPLGIVQLFDDGQRSSGIRYLKKLVAEALTFAVIVGILYGASLLQAKLMDYVLGDTLNGVISVAAIPDIFEIGHLAGIIIIQLAAVGGMFKAGQLANEIVGA